VTPVGEHPGIFTRQLGKGRHDGQAQLLGKTQVRLVKRADHLAAELDDAAVGQCGLLDAPTRAVARFEHQHVGARLHQVACRTEAREPGAHHHNVIFHGGILS
jgi:hypothetical protein